MTDTAPPWDTSPPEFNLSDHEAAASSPDDVTPASAVAYTDLEVAELAAALSAYGLPVELMDEYHAAFVSRTLPFLELLEMGDALAAMGITRSSGVGRLPGWLRVAAGGLAIGVGAVMVRRSIVGGTPAAPAPGAAGVGAADG